ncbi:hypothetical protein D9619_006094 [Psilocybe cf. subviscida]|uniref:Fungal-type protein kinase domain-containing protein n=1 Tax=Psilocybe cf. subviscida TaxID=2480587 RepID=A0A8H5EY23_9AGAR|nr:hypothetical protein D9619_006094 [Psilocybe cf. subviscida]
MLKAQHLLNKHRDCDVEDSLAVHFNLPVGSQSYELLKDINRDFCRRVGALPANFTGYIPNHDAAVRYNFQHDLESLWWLVLFYITKCVGHQPSEDYAEFIFQKTLTPSSERSECFIDNFRSSGGRSLHPRLKEPFKDLMEKLRAALYEEYVAREAFGQLTIPESYSYIHGLFAKQVTELLQHNNSGWKDVPISR